MWEPDFSHPSLAGCGFPQPNVSSDREKDDQGRHFIGGQKRSGMNSTEKSLEDAMKKFVCDEKSCITSILQGLGIDKQTCQRIAHKWSAVREGDLGLTPVDEDKDNKNTQSDSPLVCMTSSPQNEQKKMQERNNARKQPEASAANSPRFNPLKVGDLRKPIAKMNADEFLAVLDQIEKELETKKE
eukprot:m.31984 g.31984  ORF g.31984 m.31984 type:complete len:185 (+) comp31582_c1_seq4:83-637(+)